MIRQSASIVAAALMFAGIASAAPMPRQFVVNDGTRECGVFWGGDEFTVLELPAGWRDHREGVYLHEVMADALPYDAEFARKVCGIGYFDGTRGSTPTVYSSGFTSTHRIQVYGFGDAYLLVDDATGSCGEAGRDVNYSGLPFHKSYLHVNSSSWSALYGWAEDRAAKLKCDEAGYGYAGQVKPASSRGTARAKEQLIANALGPAAILAAVAFAAAVALAAAVLLLWLLLRRRKRKAV